MSRGMVFEIVRRRGLIERLTYGKRGARASSGSLLALLEVEPPRVFPQRLRQVAVAGDALQFPRAQSLEKGQADRQRHPRVLHEGHPDGGAPDPNPRARDLLEDLVVQV